MQNQGIELYYSNNKKLTPQSMKRYFNHFKTIAQQTIYTKGTFNKVSLVAFYLILCQLVWQLNGYIDNLFDTVLWLF
jgi:hypothetical protein